jgi:membrane protease YdiL (CAAX protease family)
VLWTWASGALFDREGATSSGLGGPLWVSAREMAQGIAVGFFLLLPALFIMGTGASFSIQFSAFRLGGVANFLILSLTLLLAATAEELVFRGYGFLWLCRSLANGLDGLFGWFGWGGGRPKKLAWSLGLAGPTLVFAVVFGLLHMGNEGHTHLATLNTVLAGLWLTVALFRSRAMWMPIGLHFGWNWGQGLFFGLPVSGNGGEGDAIVLSSPMTLSFDGVEWIAGGTYGVEGSVGCTVALLMGCLIAGAGPRRSASHQMAALRPKRVGGSTP